MTEVLFGFSVAFVGYAVYVLVDEQMSASRLSRSELQPVSKIDTPEIETPQPLTRKLKSTPPAKKPVLTKVSTNLPEQVGTAAGKVYRHLEKNGLIPVKKLISALGEDNKLIQRSIGWLAQEGKIELKTENRVETISLV